MDLTTRKVEVTAHNHGFAVDAPLNGDTRTPYGLARVSHVGLNDNVVEGLELRNDDGRILGFSVQYHPEAAAGPHDAAYLFDRFVTVMADARGGSGIRPEPRPAPSLEGQPTPESEERGFTVEASDEGGLASTEPTRREREALSTPIDGGE